MAVVCTMIVRKTYKNRYDFQKCSHSPNDYDTKNVKYKGKCVLLNKNKW